MVVVVCVFQNVGRGRAVRLRVKRLQEPFQARWEGKAVCAVRSKIKATGEPDLLRELRIKVTEWPGIRDLEHKTTSATR